QEHDAEDASQATSLALAKSAASIRKHQSVGSWLYGVAHRVACKARVESARRRALERRPNPPPAPDPAADVTWRELRAALDEELARLPDKHRAPLLLCYLEGKTQDEAAAGLSWPRGTLKRRLERGRELLRSRLARRGITLSAGLFVAALGENTAVPAALACAAVEAATAYAAAPATVAGAVSAQAAALAEGG